MNRLSPTNIAITLGFFAVGVVVSLAVALPQRAEANPEPGVSYVWRGTEPSGQYCYPWYDPDLPGHHPCWHDENYGNYTAIDYSYPGVGGDSVWLDYTGDFQLFKIAETDYCTGVRAKIYLGNYNESNYKGDLHYLHIDPNELWMDQEVPHQMIYIGDVLTDGELDPDCSWDDPHLHQSARVSAETPFYTNKLADPTGDDEWVHAIMWAAPDDDTDGDELRGYVWTNESELYIGTEPFVGCPDSPSDNAWPPDIDNNAWVNISDVLQYSGRVPKNVGDPDYLRRLDLNADGKVDIVDVLVYKSRVGPRCAG